MAASSDILQHGPGFSWLIAALLEQAPGGRGGLHWAPRNSDHQSCPAQTANLWACGAVVARVAYNDKTGANFLRR
jgi:hypothetical protein